MTDKVRYLNNDPSERIRISLKDNGDGTYSETSVARIDQSTPGVTNAVANAPYDNVANQVVAYTGTAAQSAAVNALTTSVIVTLTTDGAIKLSSNPTAVATDYRLAAYQPSPPLKVTPGTTKISIIRLAVSGDAWIAEFAR